MKTLAVTAAALMLLSAAPAFAMSCCGGKGKAGMCAKGSMAMSSGAVKGKKGCCCESMRGGMSSKRS